MCGGMLSRYRASYDCQSASNQVKLQSIGVTMAHDRKGIHPERFCHGCYSVCTKKKKATDEGRDYTPRLTMFEWEEHEGDDCTVCANFGKPSRKRKKAPVGRPSEATLDLVTHIKEVASQGQTIDLRVREEVSHHTSVSDDLKCLICHLILDRPLQLTTCNRMICMECCLGHIYKRLQDNSCPCGAAHSMDTSTLIPVPKVVATVLESLTVPCGSCMEPIRAGTQLDCTLSLFLHKILLSTSCIQRPCVSEGLTYAYTC